MAPIEETIGFAIARLCKEHRNSISEALAGLDVHVGQELLLRHLWANEGLAQSQLADGLCAEPPTITKMLQRMEQSGLIERRPDVEDARVSRVYLTERGRSIQEPVERAWAVVESRLTSGMTAEERMLLRRLLIQARNNIS